MTRKEKLYLNIISSLIQQIIVIICGFILPRAILDYYGSTVNGLVSSITQFLGFISFLQMGIGAVVQSAWYKPLAENDNQKISEIYISAENFFRKIAKYFLFYVLILCVLYPIKVKSDFSYTFVIILIIVLSISLFIQYYFGITNQLLLYADQKAYVYLLTQSILILLNTGISLLLIKLEVSIHIVKFGASLIFAINPIILELYIRKTLKINKKLKLIYEPINQKLNGFVQHMSSVIMENTDVAILTIFSTLKNVSIYYIYYLVVYGVRQVITSLTIGIQAMLGNMLISETKEYINFKFSNIELYFHIMVTFCFSAVLTLLTPFVLVYTKGITDANYNVPIFSMCLTMAFATYCYRLPYYTLVKAAGHFKETQNSAIIEVLINIIVSICCVIKFGLIGVAIGTLIANIYRTIYFILYLKNNIINRPAKIFIKLITLDIVIFLLSYIISMKLEMRSNTFSSWMVYAVQVSLICGVVTLIIMIIGNTFFYKQILNKIRR